MQAALDVEEGETPSDTNGSTTESDESGNRPKKKARTGEDFLDNVDEEEEDEAEEDDTDADNDSDESLPQPLGGSDDDSDSKDDLQEYKEYLEEHHMTDLESSRESK
ncbi:secreted acidic protein 1A-like [Raphanus sativus]|nr:secreted acidic protein 1A-like [Raphanus sativus]